MRGLRSSASLLAGLLLGWSGTVMANPAEAPKAAAPKAVAETKPAAGPDAALLRKIVRALKTAEQEGFEHHDLARHQAIFTADATATFGRLPEPDTHDVRFDRATLDAVLTHRYRRPPTGREQVFFFDIEPRREDQRIIVEARLTRRLFGGREELGRRYTLVPTPDGWRVKAMRSWPLVSQFGGVPTEHNAEGWKTADETAKAALADEAMALDSKLFALIQARWLTEAYEVARRATEADPKAPGPWLSRARIALEIGKVQDALASAKQSKALDPNLALPVELR